MKKLLIITYYWPPSGGPGVQRWLKFLKYFPANNCEPVVLTVDPERASYPLLDDSLLTDVAPGMKVHKTKTSEPYSWYKRITGKGEIPYSGFANEGRPGQKERMARFMRGNLFIPDPRRGWNRYALKKALEIISSENINGIITTSPPHSTQLIGLKLKKKTGLPWIADLRDPWTDIYYYRELRRTAAAAAKDAAYERAVLEQADRVVVVSAQIKRTLLHKSDNVRAEKIALIPNGYDESDFVIDTTAEDKRFVITYTGTLSEEYNIATFLDSVTETMKHMDVDYVLKFVGRTADAVQEKIRRALPAAHLEFIPHVEHAEAVRYMMSSTALLLVIPDVERNKGILTGKLFEYLAAGKPIIGIGPDDGDAAEIIERCKAGKLLPYHRKKEMGEYLAGLIAQWKNHSMPAAEANCRKAFSRECLAADYVRIINSVC